MYTDADRTGTGDLGNADDWRGSAVADDMTTDEDKEVLSDGNTISWEIENSDLSFNANGESITISGILANAYMVGNGEDVTAVVRVNGAAVHSGTLKLSDVTTGAEVTVTAAEGLQCVAPSGEDAAVATIFFKEGFTSAFTGTHALVLTLRGIPEGVTVSASLTGKGTALEDDGSDLAVVALKVGDTEGADDEGNVVISATGSGQIIYEFDATEHEQGNEDPPVVTAQGLESGETEWNTVELTFKWAAGAPPLTSGTVSVGFYPVDDDKSPRYAAGDAMDVLVVDDCVTTLVFPFVTNMYGYETGVAITNTSAGGGMCSLSFVGTRGSCG